MNECMKEHEGNLGFAAYQEPLVFSFPGSYDSYQLSASSSVSRKRGSRLVQISYFVQKKRGNELTCKKGHNLGTHTAEHLMTEKLQKHPDDFHHQCCDISKSLALAKILHFNRRPTLEQSQTFQRRIEHGLRRRRSTFR